LPEDAPAAKQGARRSEILKTDTVVVGRSESFCSTSIIEEVKWHLTWIVGSSWNLRQQLLPHSP
jgi:hypothetical protein